MRRQAGIAPSPGQGRRPDVLGSSGPNTPAAESSLWLGAVCKAGWDGGRMQAQRRPGFDPLPNPLPAPVEGQHSGPGGGEASTEREMRLRPPPKRPLASFERAAPPKALPGRSLAELGSLVPSKLPQGSLEPRHSPPERGPPAWTWPGRLRRPLKSPLRRAPRRLAGRSTWWLRGLRSRPGVSHAGAPAWRGLGGAARSENARALSKGSSDFWAFEPCRHLSFADDDRFAG